MKPAAFEYARVRSVDEAIHRLAQDQAETKLLAGGQSLLPMMKLRLARPAMLIDINPIRELDYVRVVDGQLQIGATARTAGLQGPVVRKHCPLLAAAADLVGYAAIRHRGTLCGSLAHADPAAELPLAIVCLDASLIVRRLGAERTIDAVDFFQSYFATALRDDEMLVEVRIPVSSRTGWAFVELNKRAGDFALVGVAVQLRRNPDGRIALARVGLGAVADRPIRVAAAEATLVGQAPTPETFRAAAEVATSSLTPSSDVHASSEYRRKIARVLVERALAEAWAKTL